MIALISNDIVAMLATLFSIWLLRPLAVRLGFVDKPGGRKQHQNEVPLIGGIAIFFGFCFALLSLPLSLQSYRALIAGSSLLLIIGVIDDFCELSSRFRLLGQAVAALCLALWGHKQIYELGNLFFSGNISLGIISLPFTVIAVIGFLNAMNMMDGQDGLAGGVALGQVLLLAYLSWQVQDYTNFSLLIMMVSLLAVFLCFNMRLPWRSYASIFMGDAGSTFIAFLIAWFAVSTGQSHTIIIKPVLILWVLAFPIFDLLHVSLLRFKQKRPLLAASRDHFHHILHVAGFDTAISTPLLALFSFGLGIVGILLNNLGITDGWLFLSWLLALLIYLFLVKLVRQSIQ